MAGIGQRVDLVFYLSNKGADGSESLIKILGKIADLVITDNSQFSGQVPLAFGYFSQAFGYLYNWLCNCTQDKINY